MPDGRRVGDVGDCDEGIGCVLVAAEDYVGGGGGGEEGWEGGEVGEEVGGGGGEGVLGYEGFGGDGGDDAALGWGGDELVEGGLELFGHGYAGLHGANVGGLLRLGNLPIVKGWFVYDASARKKGARPHIFIFSSFAMFIIDVSSKHRCSID